MSNQNTAAAIRIEHGNTTLQTTNAALAATILQAITGSNSEQAPKTDAGYLLIGEFSEAHGGYLAGLVRGENGQPDHYLIVSAAAEGTAEDIQWGSYGEAEPAATSEWDGFANTLALVESEHSHPAAEWAAGLSIEGHNDWYLPARRELALCYANVPELFEKRWHWSSTQYSPHDAWLQGFGVGHQTVVRKTGALRARAVRRFIID